MPDDTRAITQQSTAVIEHEPAMPKAAEFTSGGHLAPIIPQTVAEVAMIASAIIRAGLAPDSYQEKSGPENERADKTKAKIMIGIMKGAEVGLPPITALSTIAIINNRPCIWGDGAVALVQRSGLVEKIVASFEGDPEKVSAPRQTDHGEADHAPIITDFHESMTAVYRIWRKGQSEPYEGSFSVRDAKRSHLWGNSKKAPWIEYPKRMLMNRARAFALRDGFADALAGLAIREEVEDLPQAPAPKADTSFLDDAIPEHPQRALAAPVDQALPIIVTTEAREAVTVTTDSPASGGNPANAPSSERAPEPGKTDAAAPPDSPTGGASTKGAPQERQQPDLLAGVPAKPKRDEAFFAGEDLEIPAPRHDDRKPDWHGWGARMVALIEVAKAGELDVLRSHNATSRQRCLAAADPKIVSDIDKAFAAAEKRAA